MADLATVQRIEQLRSSLGDKLAELQRRANHAKERLTPSYYWRNPWVRFGVGAVIGLALAGRRRGQPGSEGLLHSMIRAGLSAAVTGVITRSLALPPGDE
jgi:hypothetical protein